MDVSQLFYDEKAHFISSRAVKTEQIYINNTKLQSKSAENIANSIKSALNAIDPKLINMIRSSNKDQASNENAAILRTFNFTSTANSENGPKSDTFYIDGLQVLYF